VKTGTKRSLEGWRDPRGRGYFRRMHAKYDAPMRQRRLARRQRLRVLLALVAGLGAVIVAIAAAG
jgi:hypothetical protein